MKKELSESLRQVVELADQMIDLAKTGSGNAGGVECGIIFGTLRDCGYKLKRTAEQELSKAGLSPPGQGDDDVAGVAAGTSGPSEAEPRTEPATKVRKKVLIVDDEKDVVTYLRAWFEDHGFNTSTAEDGVEAMAAISQDRPALITLDMSMPEKSGVRVYREIKEEPSFKDIPVIIITGIGEPMRNFLGRTRQVPEPDGFISKPIELNELATLVKQLVA